MKRTDDFSTPRRMSASAFVIMLVKTFKRVIAPQLIAIVIALTSTGDDGDGDRPRDILLFVAVALAAVSVLVAFFSYFFRKFYISDGNLIIKSGFIARNRTSIPLSRIHTLRTNRGFLYRVLGVRGVSVDTLVSKGEEVELILDEADWRKLLSRIETQEESADTIPDSETPPLVPVADETIKLSNRNLIKDALCQNHLNGLLLVGVIVGYVSDYLNDVDEETSSRIFDSLSHYVEGVDFTTRTIVAGILVVYSMLVLLSLWRIYLRYANMSVTIDDTRLSVERGFVSRFSSRFARNKVTALTVKINPLERMAGLDTVTLSQAENVSDDKEVGEVRFYGSGLSTRLLDWWLGDAALASPVVAEVSSGRGVMWRLVAANAIVTVVIFFVLWHFLSLSWAIGVSAIYMAISLLRGYMAMRHSRIALTDGFLKVGSGRLAETVTYLNYFDIEEIILRRSFLTPFTRRVSLAIATNGQQMTVRSLYLDEAERIYNLILMLSLKR